MQNRGQANVRKANRAKSWGGACNFPSMGSTQKGHIPQIHASKCSNASKQTNLTEITAGLHFLLLGSTLQHS